MAFSNFIPQIWNAQMLLDFKAQATAAALTNRQYEGDARVGNKVKITTAVDLTMKDYKTGVEGQGARTTAPDAIDNTQIELDIDQEKSFDFLVDDIDRRQAAGSLDVYTESAGRAMGLDADSFLFSTAIAGVHADNVVTHSEITTAKDALNAIRDLRKALNKQNVPLAQRVVFVNAEFAGLLLDAESKLTAVDTSGDGAGLRNGTLGGLLGFRVVETENMGVDADVPAAVAWYTPSVAFVSQINETEALRDVDSFSDRIRGLHVYGAKVLRSGVGVATFVPAAESSSSSA